MATVLGMWLKAAAEVEALRAQLAYLEEAWLRAEADADYWYFQANNQGGPGRWLQKGGPEAGAG